MFYHIQLHLSLSIMRGRALKGTDVQPVAESEMCNEKKYFLCSNHRYMGFLATMIISRYRKMQDSRSVLGGKFSIF